jgi:hypothetical protein
LLPSRRWFRTGGNRRSTGLTTIDEDSDGSNQMRRTRLVLFGALALSTLFVGACTESPNHTTPPPATSTNSTTAPATTTTMSLPAAGAPKVEHPLTPNDAYWADPCKLLTPAQLSKVNLPDATAELKGSYPGGPACNVISHHTESRAVVQAPTTYPEGISSLYILHKEYPEEPHGYFIPTLVSGFPAVLRDAADTRDVGECTVYVGVNERQVFSVHYDTALDIDETKLKKSCTLTKETAAQIIATLQKST